MTTTADLFVYAICAIALAFMIAAAASYGWHQVKFWHQQRFIRSLTKGEEHGE